MLIKREEKQKEGERSYRNGGLLNRNTRVYTQTWVKQHLEPLFIVCQDFLRCQILPLRGQHFRTIPAYFTITDYLRDLNWWFKIRTSGKVKLTAIYLYETGICASSLGVLSQKVIYGMWQHACNPVKTQAGRGITFKPSANIVQLSYSSESDPICVDKQPRNIISQ